MQGLQDLISYPLMKPPLIPPGLWVSLLPASESISLLTLSLFCRIPTMWARRTFTLSQVSNTLSLSDVENWKAVLVMQPCKMYHIQNKPLENSHPQLTELGRNHSVSVKWALTITSNLSYTISTYAEKSRCSIRDGGHHETSSRKAEIRRTIYSL